MVEPGELVTYLNGEMVPHSQAVTALKGQQVQSAGGVYDSERTFNRQIFKLDQHLQRLYHGLEFAKIDPGIAIDEMSTITLRVLDANLSFLGPSDEFVMTQIVSLSGPSSPGEEPGLDVVVFCQPLDFSTFAMSYLTGVRLVTPATYGLSNEAAAGGKLGGRQVIPLMTNREGIITECTGANFMFVRDSRIKLPDRHNVLPGVSMQTVLELADQIGIGVDEEEYSTYDVYEAEEAFVSSTRYCMLPIASINGYSLGNELPGPVTAGLLDTWRDRVGVDFVRQALDHARETGKGTRADGA